MRKAGIYALTLLLALAAGLFVSARGQSRPASKTLALVGARIYPSPSARPIDDGVVLIRDGKITAVGARGRVKIPRGVRQLDCSGMTLVAGFWNSHVHFTELKWEQAATLPASQLTRQMQEMLTRYGFTTVFDTGSYWELTKVIRWRVEAGEALGPKIFSSGEILFPKGGTPPAAAIKGIGSIVRAMPEAENPRQAADLVRRKIAAGMDAVKIYAQTFWDPNLKMPPEVIKAITAEAHRLGKLVLAHPSNTYGLHASVDAGVDVLLHTTPQTDPWDEALLSKMRRKGIALVPTLKLWRVEGERGGAPASAVQAFQDRGVEQLGAYFRAGGTILFGTDVGYVTDYDPTEEYEQMARAGMSFKDILASLTTSPAARFGESRRKGRIAPGMDADIVLLSSDPAADVKALSGVRYTLRKGEIIYRESE